MTLSQIVLYSFMFAVILTIALVTWLDFKEGPK